MRASMSVTAVVIVCVMTLSVCLARTAAAGPSENLRDALDTAISSVAIESKPLQPLLEEVIRHAEEQVPGVHVSVAIEYEETGKAPRAASKLAASSLRQQLDSIASEAGYSWQGSGEWLQFVPKGRLADPSYIMNKKIPGKVVVSRDPAKATRIRDWLSANKVTSSRDIHTLTWIEAGKPLVPDRSRWKPLSFSVQLDNPTLREYMIAYESLYGHDYCTFTVREDRDSDGKVKKTSLSSWGVCTEPAKSAPPAK